MFIKILWIVGGILLNFIILNISQILSKHFSDNDKYFRTPLQYFSICKQEWIQTFFILSTYFVTHFNFMSSLWASLNRRVKWAGGLGAGAGGLACDLSMILQPTLLIPTTKTFTNSLHEFCTRESGLGYWDGISSMKQFANINEFSLKGKKQDTYFF